LGFGGEQDPSKLGSRAKYQEAVKRLDEATRGHIRDVLLPQLRAEFTAELQEAFTLELAPDEPATILFGYPRSGEEAGSGYLRPVVRLELGARSDHHPTRNAVIRTYAAEAFPELFKVATCNVVALAPERTLVEKALIFHTAHAKGRVGKRSSRHAYDLMMMGRANVTAMVTRDLFEGVAKHKLVFFDEKTASEAPTTGIRMVPEGDLRQELEKDYRAMREMFFREPPSFQEVLDGLREVERALNALVGR
jgi:hypothetical protein